MTPINRHPSGKEKPCAIFALQALIALFLLFTAPSFSWAQSKTPSSGIDLPDIGDASQAYMSPMEEQRLGEAFMRTLRRSLKFVDDPEVEEYIQALGYRLVAQLNNDMQQFSFFVIQDPSINAFAGPGGHIGVHTGLMLMTDNENELASVLAHEIAHVSQHHLARTFETSSKMSLPATAAIIAAIILGRQNSQLGEAALATTLAGTQQTQINFTRAHEQEADRVGMQVLAQSGFDPMSMPDFFEKLQRNTRYYDSAVPEFLRTHPVTLARVADSRNRAEQYERHSVQDNPAFYLMQAKLRIMTAADPEQAAVEFADSLKTGRYRNEDAQRYGHALALMAREKYDEAQAEIQSLLKKDPTRIAYILAAAGIETGKKNHDAALKIYREALNLYPRNYPLTIAYATALLDNKNASQAQTLLLDYLRYRDPNPLIYKLLARADGEAGQNVEAHQMLAEYDYLNGETMSAIEHLNLALGMVKGDDNYRASRIQARLKELKQEATAESRK